MITILELNKITDKSQYLDLITRAKDAYYNTGEVIMDDATYDHLIKLSGKEDTIGIKPRQDTRFPVLKHEIPMCSLNKANSVEEVLGWMTAMKIQPNQLLVEPKYDGLSLDVTYSEEGHMESAILRGDGFEGENVIDNVKQFLPECFNNILQARFSIRGEVVITQTNFDKLPKGDYANRRNCVSGIIRRLDKKYCDLLSFICYDIKLFDCVVPSTEVHKLALIKKLGFSPSRVWNFEENLFEILEPERTGEILLDGLVLKHKDSKLTHRTGVGANGNPLLQLAYKFPAISGATYIRDVVWEINASKLTPVAIVDPTEMQGSSITRVSLAGLNQFKKLDLHIGSAVQLKRANDVIPVIAKKLEEQTCEKEKLEIPKVCPACGAEIVENSTGSQIICSNDKCKGKLVYILADDLKVVLKTKGFGKSLVEQLANSDKIETIVDLFRLSPEEIQSGCNMSLARCQTFHEKLHEALNACTSDKILLLFAIEGLGKKKLEAIKSYSISEILGFSLELCQDLFGKAAGRKFYDFITKNGEDINALEHIRQV